MHDPALPVLLWMSSAVILIIFVSVPLALGRIKPNGVYGVRTRATLSDEKAWYRGNTFGGKTLLWVGVVELAVFFALYHFTVLQSDRLFYSFACLLALLTGLMVAAVRIQIYLKSL